MKIVVAITGLFWFSMAIAAPPDFQDYAQRARVNFALFCAGCHQMTGKGAPGIVPDLGEYLGRFAQHPESRSFLARVPGASSSPLDNAELAEVLNWILYTMNEEQLTSDFRPYTKEEVAEYRKSPLLEVIAVRNRLVELIVHSYQAGK